VNLSIIIPTRNRAISLVRALHSAMTLDYPSDCYEIIAVDNASVDGTQKTVQNLQKNSSGPCLRYVREELLGLHHARHAGARAAKGEVLVFTDDDATFDRGWLRAYATAFAERPEMAAAGGPVRPVWEVPPPKWLIDYIGDRKIIGVFSLMEPYREFRLEAKGFFFGVNMAIRRSVLFQVGGFNPEAFGDIWLGDGETGLNRKLWNRGMLVGYVPEAVVYHHIPEKRMTVEYLRRRVANEGACTAYNRFHSGVPDPLRLLRHAAAMIVRNSKTWVAALLVTGCKDPASLRLQLRAATTRSQLKYVFRLLHDKEFRNLVQKEGWLNESCE
jgi:glucosyl-dolichyl phosphate glucuronosyltransferase